MNFTDLQEVARKAADVLCLYRLTSLIGGGAPRDVFLGAPIKDIDLFVDVRSLDHEVGDWNDVVTHLANVFRGHAKPSQTASDGGTCTVDIDLPGGLPPLQVIPVERCVLDDVHEYDFGLSKIVVTPRGVLRTDDFDRDVRHHTLTYVAVNPTADQQARSAERLLRLRRKHPGFALVNCEALCSL